MFHKILVAVDRSEDSEKVLAAAISLAKAMEASLMLLHVLSSEEEGCPQIPTSITLEYCPVDSKIFENYRKHLQDYEKQGLEMLRSYTDKATAEGICTEFTQNSGNSGRTICEMAQTWEADLIMLGRHGRSGLNELILGSVSNYVLHHAPCSVLTIHRQDQNAGDRAEAKQVAMAS